MSDDEQDRIIALEWMNKTQKEVKTAPRVLRAVADRWENARDGIINGWEVLTLIYYLSLLYATKDPKRMFKELTMIAVKILDNTIGGLLDE